MQSLWLPAALIILVLNVGYCIRKVLDDLVEGRKTMAGLGVACLVGVNAIIGWMVYISIATSTDL